MTPSIIPEKPPLIIACCAWYHERPDMLAQMVTSLDGVADRLVCLDGPWQSYLDGNLADHPDLALTSPLEQRQAIIDAALRIGLPCLIEHPIVPWPTQHAKRTDLLALGRRWADSPNDFLFTIDADEEVKHPLHAQLRRAINEIPTLKLVVRVRGPSMSRMPRLIRAHPDVVVEAKHQGYRLKNGPWLGTSPEDDQPRGPEANIGNIIELIHHHNERDHERKLSCGRERQARVKRGEK